MVTVTKLENVRARLALMDFFRDFQVKNVKNAKMDSTDFHFVKVGLCFHYL